MQTRVTDQAAFVLRRRDWRDTSLILDLLTLDYGRISVLAKGARRSRSRALYQPFVLLQLGWSGKRDLKTLTAIDGEVLPIDEKNYLELLYVNELLGAFLPPRESSPLTFKRYLELLRVAEHRIDESRLREFELELVQSLGYFPDISHDALSGEAIRADRHYQFQIDAGFIACSETDSDSISGQIVIDWIDKRYRQQPVLRLAKSILRSTIDFNLHGKALKSRDVYLEIMRRK